MDELIEQKKLLVDPYHTYINEFFTQQKSFLNQKMGLLERIKYFAQNTTLHGLIYVADQTRPILVRIFWMAVFVVSVTGMLIIFKGSYKAFTNNAISFVTETTYLDWNTTFPAVTLCEITGSEIIYPAEDSTDDYSIVQQFIADLIFFTGNCYSCSSSCSSCEKLNFLQIVKQFRKNCSNLLGNCEWLGSTFDCCEKFLPLETEYGVCFTINSMHTGIYSGSQVNLFSNRKIGAGELTIEAKDDVRIYLHAPEDVPFINSDPDLRQDVMQGESFTILFKVTEIQNEENVKFLSSEKRGCRFPWENEGLRVHKLYSYSTCIVQCHVKAHLDLCNCTHHLMPVYNRERYCDREGLLCLSDYFETVNRLHAKGFEKSGLVCECVPSCVEPEYKIVSQEKGIETKNRIKVKMQSLPTTRFQRIVVRTTLDFVVSIGGTVGLFTGASLLSLIEIIFLFIHRRNRVRN